MITLKMSTILGVLLLGFILGFRVGIGVTLWRYSPEPTFPEDGERMLINPDFSQLTRTTCDTSWGGTTASGTTPECYGYEIGSENGE